MRLSSSARRRHERSGFTIVEITIAAALLGTILGSAAWFQIRTQAATKATIARSTTEASARRALDRAISELSCVIGSQLVPDPTGAFGTDSIVFRSPASTSDTGVVTPTSATRLAAVLAAGEADNQVDDDGDGLVDERDLVLTRNVGLANERSVTLCSGVARWLDGETANAADDNGNGLVDESGFNVQRTGDLLSVRLTVQKAAEGGARLVTTISSATVLRN